MPVDAINSEKGHKQSKAVTQPQYHCQAVSLVNIKQQDESPREAC